LEDAIVKVAFEIGEVPFEWGIGAEERGRRKERGGCPSMDDDEELRKKGLSWGWNQAAAIRGGARGEIIGS